MKLSLAVTVLTVILAGIIYLFWQQEVKYILPTPVPVHYKSIDAGEQINLPGYAQSKNTQPQFFHFFNPDCPCSRFNVPHVSSLIKKYGDKISFAIVVLANEKTYSEKEIRDKFDADVPVFFDTTLAAACGVYSTPQAVLINSDHTLYYRGNYNRSRYCSDKNTNYAQMAIDSLLNHTINPKFSVAALKSYGCELPVCTK